MNFPLSSKIWIINGLIMIVGAICTLFAQKPIREAQAKKLHEIFSGEDLQKKKADILVGQYEWIDLPQDEQWLLKEREVTKILHQYHPDLSVHVYHKKILIFHIDTN